LEAGLLLLRRDPLALLRWLLRGARTPILAAARAAGSAPDPALLPLDRALLASLHAERARGRRLLLWTRGDPELARAIAERLGLFEAVIPAADAERAAAAAGAPTARPPIDAPRTAGGLGLWLRALRLHQWAKNLLVLLPVLLAGPLATRADWADAAIAFLVLCLAASAGYLINDLLDLEADRRHESKRERPFAAGALPLAAGLAAVPLLLATAGLVALLLPPRFLLAAGAYLALTLAYSFALKRVPMLDVVSLGGLFTLRVIAGAFAITAPLSYWLLTFSMFLFLSLALVKRYAELERLARRGGEALADRGYNTLDLPLLASLGLASGVAATLIFVVYLVTEHFPKAIYTRPGWLWLAFPILLYWLARAWRLTLHGKMNEDPVLFALRDRASLLMVAMVFGLVVLAW
ncbi:MAG: UbiA family prenyltransferase, partial [Geminicoccaceae bacterium]|nr:UbiA family prenyltransferase [Geminicoccaceae bacterium]